MAGSTGSSHFHTGASSSGWSQTITCFQIHYTKTAQSTREAQAPLLVYLRTVTPNAFSERPALPFELFVLFQVHPTFLSYNRYGVLV